MAHELTHVVQQSTAGVTMPDISQPSDPFESQAEVMAKLFSPDSLLRGHIGNMGKSLVSTGHSAPPTLQRQQTIEAAFDEQMASLIESLHSNHEGTDTDILLSYANNLQETFQNPKGPHTYNAVAHALTNILHILQARVQKAPRDSNGVLLRPNVIGELVPWTATHPRQLEDIAPFTQENEVEWVAVASEKAPTRSTHAASAHRTSTPPFRDESKVQSAISSFGQSTTHTVIGSEIQSQESTLTEKATDVIDAKGGATEIPQGLAALKTATIDQALEAIRAVLRSDRDPSSQQVEVIRKENADTSLFNAARDIWYVTNRLYVLDRTGHISSSQFLFNLSGVSLVPGIYFFGRFAQGSSRTGKGTAPIVLLRVDGGPRVVGGDLYPSSVLQDLFPLMEQVRATLSQNAGIAIIVSSSREQEKKASFNTDNVLLAISGAKRHLAWAIVSQLISIIENPGEALKQELIGLGTTALAELIPPVGAALSIEQKLRLAEWVGTTISIAAYGTKDEIDIASQSIARYIAEWIIGHVKGKIVSAARGRAKRMIGGKETASSETSKPDVEAASKSKALKPDTEPSSEGAASKPPLPVVKQPSAPPSTVPPAPAGQVQAPESAEGLAKVIPITQARQPAEPAKQLRLGPERDVTSLDEFRRRQQAATKRLSEPPETEPQAQVMPIPVEQQEPAEMRLAAGAEGATPQASSTSTKQGIGQPTVASAASKRGGNEPPEVLPGKRPATARQEAEQSDRPSRPQSRQQRGSAVLPPEPKLSNPRATLENRAEFLAQHRQLLGPIVRRRLDALVLRLRRGVLGPGESEESREKQIKNWEEDVDRALRIQYGQRLQEELDLPFPVSGVQRIGRHEGGEYEKITRFVETGVTPKLSISSHTIDGEEVQIDNWDSKRRVPQEIKSSENLESLKFKPGAREEKIHELKQQMIKQATFARDYGIQFYEWVVPLSFKKILVDEVLASEDLPNWVRAKIRVTEGIPRE